MLRFLPLHQEIHKSFCFSGQFEISELVIEGNSNWNISSNIVTKDVKDYSVGRYVNLRVNLILERMSNVYTWTAKVPAFGESRDKCIIFRHVGSVLTSPLSGRKYGAI